MGKVAAVYLMTGESPETNMDQVTAQVPKVLPAGVQIADIKVKPFAFGLKVVELTAVMDDTAGVIEKLEEALRGVPGIQSVENTGVTLI